MSNLQYLGKHFLVGLASASLSAEEAKMLRRLQPLGVILFAENFSQDEQWQAGLSKLLSDVRNECRGEELLVSIDHEGGRVHRFPRDITRFPPAYTWAEQSKDVGIAMGHELRSLGFDLNFAPVLDIHSEESNPVIGARALATTPEEVARYGLQFREGLESAGVLSCVKHFPGHGATTKDSHLELPVLDLDTETLKQRELVPFCESFAQDAQLLMSAHVLYPALDPENPATLSSAILKTLLREQLRYKGVVISDDLEMKAIAHIPPGERAIGCLRAGIDVLLEGKSPEKLNALGLACEMAEAVDAEVKSDAVFAADLEIARERISNLLRYRMDRLPREQDSECTPELSSKKLCETLERRVDTSGRFLSTSPVEG